MGKRGRAAVSFVFPNTRHARPYAARTSNVKKTGLTSSKSDRVFKPAKAKGGCEIDTSKTALVLIEYQRLRSVANFPICAVATRVAHREEED